MAGPYRPIPVGNDAFFAKLEELQRKLNAARNAANIQNSAITGGTGLTVKDTSTGQTIQLVVDDLGDLCNVNFAPPAAFQVGDWVASIKLNADSSLGGGALALQSPSSPTGNVDDQPPQFSNIQLRSGDGTTGAASLSLQATGIQLDLTSAAFGNPAAITLGQLGTASRIEEDATSWRLFAGDASLIFPQGTSEVRVRDINNAAYTVIRASAFTVTSSREAKQDIRDLGWSAADVVMRAKAQRYRYRPETADPDRIHVGPMVEDLPAELVDNTDPDSPAVNVVTLVGVLWAAVGELTERVRILEGLNSQP